MGPTGTGKSALAIRVAQHVPTVIINADAMQMVRELRVVTARPTVVEEAQAEHALYGVLPATMPTSVARWLELVAPLITAAWEQGKLPLLVGGTGMYIKALREGLVQIPPIPTEIRERVRRLSAAELYAALEEKGATAEFKPGDTQRLARALEVVEATGKPIGWWQQQKTAPQFPDAQYRQFYLQLHRDVLYERLNTRFAAMMRAGAVEEVRALMALDLPVDTPVLRAHGVPEIMAMLRGTMPEQDAIARAQQNTRNYAKRQMTWLRHSAADAQALDAAMEPQGLSHVVCRGCHLVV